MSRNFETSLTELETIVTQMEAGDLPLEQSLELFERGVNLYRYCQQQLDDAERRVDLLIKGQDGQYTTVPFTADND